MRVRPGETKAGEFVLTLLLLAITSPFLGWLAYFWERSTGMTFVFGRGGGRGHASTPAHLLATYHGAIALTVLGAAAALVLFYMRKSDQDRPAR